MPFLIPVLEALGLMTPEIAAVLGAVAGVFAIIHAWRLLRRVLVR